MKTLKSLGLFVSLLLLQCAVLAQSSGYHVANKITLGGEGGWDYLAMDSAARRGGFMSRTLPKSSSWMSRPAKSRARFRIRMVFTASPLRLN